jgi:hypothetical protein
MDITLFVCEQAPVLADAATRMFNEMADPQLAHAFTAGDGARPAGRVSVLVSMGGTQGGGCVDCDARIEWALLDPRAMVPNQERAYLGRLRRHVVSLVQSRRWLAATAGHQAGA